MLADLVVVQIENHRLFSRSDFQTWLFGRYFLPVSKADFQSEPEDENAVSSLVQICLFLQYRLALCLRLEPASHLGYLAGDHWSYVPSYGTTVFAYAIIQCHDCISTK